MSISAIFFDMGGTIDCYGFTPELRLEKTPGIQALLLHAGIDLGLNNQELYKIVSKGLQDYHQWSLETMEELPSARVWAEYILAGFSVDGDQLASVSEDLMCYVETQLYHREMRPEIPEVLTAIHQMGLKIGIISNVNSRGQVPTNLAEYNISHFFNPVVLSSEYGWRKPDPAIFHHAARLAKVPTSACLYVGDRIARDILGARKAGVGCAVQILHNFDHGEEDLGAEPDYVIEDMRELLGIIEKEMARGKEPPKQLSGQSSTIRAILFDAGDILYYRPNRNERFIKFLDEQGINFHDFNYSEENELLKQKSFRGLITRDEYLEAKIRFFGITDEHIIECGKKLLSEQKDNVEFYEGVPQTLRTLKEKGFLMGIVTDTANTVHAKLQWFDRGGFSHVWDSIISSKEIGCRKPEPKIYMASLEQLGVSVDEAVFIGHKIAELDGASEVGLKTIAFNYEEGTKADYYIEKFSDLLEVPVLLNKGK